MRDLLRSVWNEPRAPDPPQPLWWDWALVGVLVPLALLEGALRPALPGRAIWVPVVVGLTFSLVWRRTRPLLMVAVAFVATCLVTVLMGGEQPDMYTLVVILVLPYALLRWGSGREAVRLARAHRADRAQLRSGARQRHPQRRDRRCRERHV